MQLEEPVSITTFGLERQPGWKLRHKDDPYTYSTVKKIFLLIRPCLIFVGISLLLFRVILINGIIPSESMQPTMMVGDCVIANRLEYNFSSPQRGDVIVFWSEENEVLLVKRVIGLPGDTIELYNDCIYINGCRLGEPYAYGETYPLKPDKTLFEVPEDSFFVLGDNRENSIDARYWDNSFISSKDIIGKVLFKYKIFNEDNFIKPVKSQSPVFYSDYFNIDMNRYDFITEETDTEKQT